MSVETFKSGRRGEKNFLENGISQNSNFICNGEKLGDFKQPVFYYMYYFNIFLLILFLSVQCLYIYKKSK